MLLFALGMAVADQGALASAGWKALDVRSAFVEGGVFFLLYQHLVWLGLQVPCCGELPHGRAEWRLDLNLISAFS